MLFDILDDCMKGSKQGLHIALCIYSFLGENANKITGEPSTEKKILDDKIINDSKNLDIIYNYNEPFDIHNGAMKSIILRLMKNAMYSSPQVIFLFYDSFKDSCGVYRGIR